MTSHWIPETTDTMDRTSPFSPALIACHESYNSQHYQSFHSANIASDTKRGRCPPGYSYHNTNLLQNHRAMPLPSGDDMSLKWKREKEGRCAECGIQTHRVIFQSGESSSEARTVKEPLSIQNEVHRGRCLLCYPIHSMSAPVKTNVNNGSSITQSRPMSNVISPDKVESFHSEQIHEIPTQKRSHPHKERSNITVEEAFSRVNFGRYDICDIISVMRDYPSNPTIQERGCEQLWIQSWDDETSRAIGQVGGITSIVDAMVCHLKNAQLQQYACEALQNLAACNNYNRDVIADEGGIIAITDAMYAHQRTLGVQISGCAALANIAVGSIDNKIDVADCGGIYAVLMAFESFPQEGKIILAARQVITVLGYNPASSQYVHLERDEMGDDFDMED